MTFSADLPMPPSSNMMFINSPNKKGRGRFPSPEYKAWRKEAGALLLKQWKAANEPEITKPYSMHIRLNVNHQSDVASREKAIGDLFVSTIPGFPDDRWANLIILERDRKVQAASVDVVSL